MGSLLATPKPWRRRVSGSQNDNIVLRLHFELDRGFMLTSNTVKQISNISWPRCGATLALVRAPQTGKFILLEERLSE